MSKDFLKDEKERMSARQYAQEYLGEFVEGLSQFFPNDIILNCPKEKKPDAINPDGRYYLGVDIARLGEDESTFEIIERTRNPKHVENVVTKKTLTTFSTREILRLNKLYNFKQIFIDTGGMGIGVFDQLLEEPETRRKLMALDQQKNILSFGKDKTEKRKVTKEDIYNNLLRLMERKEITLLDDPEIIQSFQSVQYEYINGKLRIFGRYAHIADGLVRAAWCVKDKSLKVWCHYS